ncbi:hypothetical protein D3C78_1697210 [compost metagenome]
MRKAWGGFDAMRRAKAALVSSKASGVTTRDTMPSCNAVDASMNSLVSVNSRAFAVPTIRVKNQAPPMPDTRPSRRKLSANVALSLATRRSHMRAKSQPAPTAAPLTAAIDGICKA